MRVRISDAKMRPTEKEACMHTHVKGGMTAAAFAGLFLAKGALAQGEAPKAEAAKVHCQGVNACKGQGACGGAGHDCAGKNECKGKGWGEMSAADCKTKGGTVKQENPSRGSWLVAGGHRWFGPRATRHRPHASVSFSRLRHRAAYDALQRRPRGVARSGL